MPDPGVGHSQAGSQHIRPSPKPSPSRGGSQRPGSNTGIVFEDDPQDDRRPTIGEQYFDEFGTAYPWQEMVVDRLAGDVIGWAQQIGEDPYFVEAWLNGMIPNVLGYVHNQINASPELRKQSPMFQNGFLNSPEGYEYIYGLALSYVRSRDARFADMVSGSSGGRGSGRRGSGRGRGAAGPTPDEIRAQFDIEELADMANDIWFNNVLTEAPDSRGIARSYVEAIVKNPKQRLDFATFVRGQVENTTRYKTIYARKPKGMSPEQFLQPLFQVASQIAGPEEAEGLAVGAAQFGGDPNAFRERLQRTDSVRNSAPFMQGLEQRMESLNSIFKG